MCVHASCVLVVEELSIIPLYALFVYEQDLDIISLLLHFAITLTHHLSYKI